MFEHMHKVVYCICLKPTFVLSCIGEVLKGFDSSSSFEADLELKRVFNV